MLNRCGLLLLVLLASWKGNAQQRQLDSLVLLEKTYLSEDTVRIKLLTDLARRYYSINPNIGVNYAEKAIQLGNNLPDKKYLAGAFSVMGANRLTMADYPAALENYQKALKINEHLGNLQGIGNNYNNIGLVYYSIFDYPRALEYYQKTLNINERTGHKTGMGNSLGNIGNIYNELHDYPKAIAFYKKALAISESANNLHSVAGNLVNIGNVYTQLQDFQRALEYKQSALKINEQLGNQSRIANNLGNIGNVYIELFDYPAALQYHERALAISEKINDKKGSAEYYTSIGKVHYFQKKYDEAVAFELKALDLANGVGSLNTASQALFNLSQIYEATEKFDSAYLAYQGYITLRDSINNVAKQKEVTTKTLQFEFSKKEDSLRQHQIITDSKLEQQVLLAAKQQQELAYKQIAINLANKEKALQQLAYLKSQADLQFEQSLTREKEEQLSLAENEKKLQATQVSLQQTQIELKDKALQSQKTQRLFYVGGIILLSLLSFFIFRNFLNQQKSNRVIQAEKQKSDALLLNILPAEVAGELKETGRAMARQFDEVTVLFTDFVDFTRISEKLSPHDLVSELHLNFKAFDEIIERHGLEKIKTIGDAYMAVSGLPVPNPQHALMAAQAAMEIQTFVQNRQKGMTHPFQIRIGLHSGPVVAGIVGVKKFAYDIWGDTVNTAARMESTSEPGKINMSGVTYALLKDKIACQYRGKITAKNKGEVDMYFCEKERSLS
ncbi:MAG: adenylate/guanylate cyclase domain-containing protein [Saprospiraceae bacterium]|nr:adenylate/guanylate cyclase domain-containing protein [Saprospiraceae bacterium]